MAFMDSSIESVANFQLISDKKAYATLRHSTPIMQNSFTSTTGSEYKSGLFNGVTSTPLSSPTSYMQNSLFQRTRLTPLRSPPLYNLSDVSNISNTNRSPKPVQNASGPLLASTRFNVNLGTYTDTKSPGLTNRIVQYSNETKQRQMPTHQAKYGTAGLFPVVHFFKKDIPTINPKQRKVMVKIASPDTSWYNSPEFTMNKIGSRSGTMQNGPNSAQISTDTETRSVLDALKEISRKRIHTTPDFEAEQEISKRQKKTENILNVPDKTKRGREEDSPTTDPQNKNSIQPLAKKICVVDMLAASYTSSQLYKERLEKGLQNKIEVESVDKILTKRTKLLNVGTQTVESEKPPENKSEGIEPPMATISLVKKKKKPKVDTEPPAEEYRTTLVFDEKRLEISRKNRLATLLCALTGETPEYLTYEKPKPTQLNESQLEVSTPTASPQKLVSILSPQNKPKHSKHVTFNLPPENSNEAIATVSLLTATVTSQSTIVSSSISVSTNLSTPTKDNQIPFSSMSNIETPKSALSTVAVNKLDFGMANSIASNKQNETEVSMKTSEGLKSSDLNQGGGFTLTPQTQANIAVTSVDSPLTFGLPQSSTMTTSPMTTQMFTLPKETTTSPKSSGFKFDLTKSPNEIKTAPSGISSLTNPPVPKFGFGEKEQTGLSTQTSLPGFSMPQTTGLVTPTFAFGTNKSATNLQVTTAAPSTFSSNTMFGTPTNTSNVTKITGGSLSNAIIPNPTSQGFSLGTNNSSASFMPSTAGSNTFNFGNSPSAPALNTGISATNMFGNQPTQALNTSFPARSSEQTISSPFNTQPSVSAPNLPFGSQPITQTSTMFGSSVVSSSVTPGFGVNNFSNAPSTTSFGFVNPVTTSTNTALSTAPSNPMFRTSMTSSSLPPSSGFGTGTNVITPGFNANATAALTFGTNTSAPTMAFGGTTNAASTFGVNTTNTPAFGLNTTNTPAFGVNASNTPGFGVNTTNTSAFGANTNNTPAFGVSTTNAPGFGISTTSAPAFGANATVAPGFGSTTTITPAFGANNNTPIFGSPAPTEKAFGVTTTSSSLFVANPASQSFNTSTTPSNMFEVNSENKPFAFGSNQTGMSGNASFNTAGTKQAFNFSATTTAAGPAFTTKAIPSFSSSFPVSNVFGATTTNSQSSTPTATSNIFKSPTTTNFGSTAPQFGAKPENSFGAKPGNAFETKVESTFGSKSDSGFGSKPENAFGGFNNSFGASNNNAPGFGGNANNANAFGASNNASSFQANSNISGFGANTNNTAGFGMNTNNSNAFAVTPVTQTGFGVTPNNANSFQTAPSGNNNTFGSNANSGNFASGNVFGNTNPNPSTFGFNSGDNSSAFAKQQASTGVFGSAGSGDTNFQFRNNPNNQGFGGGTATNATPSGQGSVFAFGRSNAVAAVAAAPPPASGVFTFGSSDATKPAFNFNAGSNQAPGGFGAANFNAASAPGFNPSQFGFVIGSGSTSGGRSRTQLKPKRRT